MMLCRSDSGEAGLEVGDLVLKIVQQTVQDAPVVWVSYLEDAAAEIAGLDFQSLDLGDRVSFRIVDDAHGGTSSCRILSPHIG
jgi:hypothetical protein